MPPINRRTFLTTLGVSLSLPLEGCGSGRETDSDFIVDPPTRGVGSFVWRTSLSLDKENKYVLRTRHDLSDNTLRVVTLTGFTQELTEYALDFNSGRVLRKNVYPVNSSEAEPINDALNEAKRIPGALRMDNPASLTRLAPGTQEPLWTYTAEKQPGASLDPRIRNPIIAADGTVYMVVDEVQEGYRPRVHALDGATGRLLWQGDWFLNPTDSSGYVFAEISMEPVISSEGIAFLEVGWKFYPNQNFPNIGKSLTILNAQTGKLVRGIPLFDSRGVWDISFTNPLLSPAGHFIATFRDSVVAMRTK